jgi:predicted metal-dependent hydrolase
MTTESASIIVSGLTVEVVRKNIKNMHLGVYPPNGRVRVAAPLAVSNDAVRLAVIGKLGWIRKQRKRFQEQPRQSAREYLSGESHYYLGQRYRLRVHESDRTPGIEIANGAAITMFVRPGADAAKRDRVMMKWYRERLKEMIPPLLDKWEKELGVEAAGWGVKRMKTKWGSCNAEARRIWLNLELVKKPPQCLEYIIVHELAHLIERKHNDRFVGLMDAHLPNWRMRQKELNAAPLGHDDWAY